MQDVDESDCSFEEMLQQRLGPDSADAPSQPRLNYPFWRAAGSTPVPQRMRSTGYLDDCYTIRISSRFDDLDKDAAALLQAAGSAASNTQELKKLRRTFVWKYHPDRIRDQEMRNKASRALSEVNAAVDATLKARLG